MKYMLDTNICIYLIRKKLAQVIQRLESLPISSLCLSSITVAELEYGVSKSRWSEKNRLALREFVAPLEVGAWDQAVTPVYGKIRALLERKGKLIGAMDLMIAAHALSLDAQLITNNDVEFKRVPGLRVANWM